LERNLDNITIFIPTLFNNASLKTLRKVYLNRKLD